ncbi:MAG TPA: hypothetical protein VFY93_00575 [Planctomycetota bacterium]|nr:hypothetical protein [Planctomycetota bacterium]
MARGSRPLLGVAGALCLVAGLFPGGRGRNEEWTLGLPFSPLFRAHRETVEQPPSHSIDEDGRRVQSSYFSSTVYSWELRVFSWSAALVALGLVLIVVAICAAWKDGAESPRAEDGGP